MRFQCTAMSSGPGRVASIAVRRAALCTLFAAVCVLGAAAQAKAATSTFKYTGAERSFTVPEGVFSVNVVAVGGAGGEGQSRIPGAGAAPGEAARVSGELSVSPGQTLYVEVGGNAQSPDEGGFNGGGDGGSGEGESGAGGGASDVRTAPRAAGLSPDTRLIVAGGGGGGGAGTDPGDGGNAGKGEKGEGEAGGHGPTGEEGLEDELEFNEGGGGGMLTDAGPGGESYCGENGQGGRARGRWRRRIRARRLRGWWRGGGYYGGGGGGGACTLFDESELAGGGGGGGGGSSLVPPDGGTVETSEEEPQVQITVPPAVVTEPAMAVTQTSATLEASVNPESGNVSEKEDCYFEYGTSASYGSKVDALRCPPAPAQSSCPHR